MLQNCGLTADRSYEVPFAFKRRAVVDGGTETASTSRHQCKLNHITDNFFSDVCDKRRCLSVCPSVSHKPVVHCERCYIGSRGFHHWVAQGLQFSETNFNAPGFRGTPVARATNKTAVNKTAKKTEIFDQ